MENAGRQLAQILRELHDDKEKPYLLNHETWEDYLEGRWNMSPRRARQLMTAETLRLQLSDTPELVTIAPKLKEGQLRALAALPAPQAVEVVKEATKQGKSLTARNLKVVKAVVIDGETGQPEPEPEKEKTCWTKCPTCGGKMRR